MPDAMTRSMQARGIPVTRANYLYEAYGDEMPDPWTAEHESMLPDELQISDDDRVAKLKQRIADAQATIAKYSPDQPRHPKGTSEGGQFAPKEGTASTPSADPDQQQFPTFEEADQKRFAQVESLAKQVAKDQGYDPDMIEVITQRHDFEVNGQTMHAAGVAHIAGEKKGIIEVYAPGLAPGPGETLTLREISGIQDTMVHEVMHQKFQTVLDAYSEERERVINMPAASLEEVRRIMAADGSLRPPYDKQFPLYQRLQPLLEGSDRHYAMSDGVSPYSLQYWLEWQNNEGAGGAMAAMHETLAEMARIKQRTGEFPKHMGGASRDATAWRNLYRAVESVYKERRRKDKT